MGRLEGRVAADELDLRIGRIVARGKAVETGGEFLEVEAQERLPFPEARAALARRRRPLTTTRRARGMSPRRYASSAASGMAARPSIRWMASMGTRRRTKGRLVRHERGRGGETSSREPRPPRLLEVEFALALEDFAFEEEEGARPDELVVHARAPREVVEANACLPRAERGRAARAPRRRSCRGVKGGAPPRCRAPLAPIPPGRNGIGPSGRAGSDRPPPRPRGRRARGSPHPSGRDRGAPAP